MTDEEIEIIIRKSPLLGPILQRWDRIRLNDCWLAAGSVAQTVWNRKFGLPPSLGITDVDLVYFDADDLSSVSEQRQAERIRHIFDDLTVWFDVKNEARVHLWYEEKFGYPIAPYKSTKDAILTFPTRATAVGIRPSGDGLEVYAPFGLDDLAGGVVRANKTLISKAVFDAKVAKWIKTWPDLSIVDWRDGEISKPKVVS